MAKFVYKMQSLLNIKEKLEDQAKTAFGHAKAILNEEEAKLAEFNKKKKRYIEQKREAMASIAPNMSEGRTVQQQLLSLQATATVFSHPALTSDLSAIHPLATFPPTMFSTLKISHSYQIVRNSI